jgi:hypothetical protein
VIQREILVIIADATIKPIQARSAKKKNQKKYPLSVKHLRTKSTIKTTSKINVIALIILSINLGKK